MVKLSIIIPIYNCEKLVGRCIESVLKQTYKNLEILLIDDGSTDSSIKICRQYEHENNNIKLILKENGGVSSARNLGIKKARGEYIQFIDSDDYIDERMCEILVKNIEEKKSDLVICGYKDIYFNKINEVNLKESFTKKIYELENSFCKIYEKFLFNSPCNKLYKKSLIEEYFDENKSLGEDLLFNINYMKGINKITYINEAFYNYMHNNTNSLTRTYKTNMFEEIVFNYKSVNDFYLNYISNKNYFIESNNIFIKNSFYCIKKIISCEELNKEEKIDKIKKILLNSNFKNSIKLNNIKNKEIYLFILLAKNEKYNFIYNFWFLKQKIAIILKYKRGYLK
ncbi:glycosyltransferase family 2 protein [Clostridium perfringens]